MSWTLWSGNSRTELKTASTPILSPFTVRSFHVCVRATLDFLRNASGKLPNLSFPVFSRISWAGRAVRDRASTCIGHYNKGESRGKISIPRVGFELAIPVTTWPLQSVWPHVLLEITIRNTWMFRHLQRPRLSVITVHWQILPFLPALERIAEERAWSDEGIMHSWRCIALVARVIFYFTKITSPPNALLVGDISRDFHGFACTIFYMTSRFVPFFFVSRWPTAQILSRKLLLKGWVSCVRVEKICYFTLAVSDHTVSGSNSA